MKSMTGFGKYTVNLDGKELTVELKSVNNRFCEINMRLPKLFSGKEETVRKCVSEYVKRGVVDVFFSFENKSADSKTLNIDMAAAKAYFSAADRISRELGVQNDITASFFLKSGDIAKLEVAEEDEEAISSLVLKAVSGAAAELDRMREREGLGIKADLAALTKKIGDSLEAVVLRAPLVVAEYREKMTARISEALGNVDIDQNRLINEVAFFCDKADINEEIQRLRSHLKQFMDTLTELDQVGRKLDFLSQEINREINTIGSKSNDMLLTESVVSMKYNLERIKEQIRNVE